MSGIRKKDPFGETIVKIKTVSFWHFCSRNEAGIVINLLRCWKNNCSVKGANIMKRSLNILGIVFVLGIILLGFDCVAFADDATGKILLKTGSAFAAVLGLIGIAIAGYFAGKSYDTYTGTERFYHGAGQFFNRKSFRRDKPTYGKTDRHSRLSWVDNIFNRTQAMMAVLMPLMAHKGGENTPEGGKPPQGPPDVMEKLPEAFQNYYKENPEKYKQSLKLFKLVGEQKANWPKYQDRYAIIDAWSNAQGSSWEDHEGDPHVDRLYPPEPQGPPEESDFRGIRRDNPLPFKSLKHAAELMKRITYSFGATLVGVTKLNPDWCYQGILRGVGEIEWEKPDHWEYAIVFATPHEWDQMYVNPTYGSSYDAYCRDREIAGKLEAFIKELGYPARSHVPPFFYDVVMPPIAIDAGLGEVARNGICITPELGCNARLACVTTNIPMEVDKPIDFGVREFCKKCKICAECCPTGAISQRNEGEEVRGYHRWVIKDEICFHGWASVATSHLPRGCRVCIAVCPYSRKNNWIHAAARYIDPRDPTGITSSALLWMQKAFFKYPKPNEFLPPPKGSNATYHKPPDWLLTEKWFDVKKTW